MSPVKYALGFYKILGFHGGDYEELCVLGCYVAWLLKEPRFGET
jgi:hypothetical protein